MWTGLTALLAWMLADFVSGLVHWWEDRAIVGASRWGYINSIRADNERHHVMPGYLLRYSWWGNINTTAPLAWGLSTICYVIHAPQLLVFTFGFLGIGNLIHRFAHEPDRRLPWLVKILQDIGLFISPKQHSNHHYGVTGRLISREESTRTYCVMSSWLNPWLDRIGFWNLLERVL